MDPLVIGLVVFVAFSSVLSLLLVQAMRRARSEGLSGGALLARLAPYLIGDLLLVIVFVAWLLR